jgi:phosphoserine phosphatase
MKTPTTFYLVRHGETQQNLERIIQGHLDTVLNETGISQGKKAAEILKNINFDNVFSSDLKRAYQTAKLITEKRNLEIQKNKLLREMSFADYEGVKIDKFHEELGDLIKYRDSLPFEKRLVHKVKDIETDEEVVNRFLDFFSEKEEETKEKNNLIVTHGAAIRTLLIYFGWADYGELPHGRIKNTAYVVLEKDGNNFTVKETMGVKKLEI